MQSIVKNNVSNNVLSVHIIIQPIVYNCKTVVFSPANSRTPVYLKITLTQNRLIANSQKRCLSSKYIYINSLTLLNNIYQ